MKKMIFFVMVTFFSLITAVAQSVAEPEFLGEVYLLTSDSTFVKLPSENSSIKAKTSPLPMASLIGGSKSFMVVKGAEAKARLSSKDNPIRFIIRCKDNNQNPETVVSVVTFEKKKKERRLLMGKTSILGSSIGEGLESLPYKAEKYGEHSYLITIKDVQPGEYGLLVGEQEVSPGNYIGFRCFGID